MKKSPALGFLMDAVTKLQQGEVEQAAELVEIALKSDARLNRARRHAPQTIEELMPLLRRKDAAGPVLRQFRQSLGLTQVQCAEICGVPRQTIANIEVGLVAMQQEPMERLLKFSAEKGAIAIGCDGPPPAALLKLRKLLGLTTLAMASKLGVRETALRRMEIGAMVPPLHVIDGYRKAAASIGIEDLERLAA